MAFDGNGNFLRLYNWVTDKTNGVPITASRVDAEDSGFAAGLTLAVTRDGQGKMAADFLPSADVTYALGSAAYRWVNANLTGTSGQTALTVTDNGGNGPLQLNSDHTNGRGIRFNDTNGSAQSFDIGLGVGDATKSLCFNDRTNGHLLLRLGASTSSPVIAGYGPAGAGTLVDMTPDQGSWATTISGAFASNPTGTLKWRRMGGLVCVWAEANITQTTNTSQTLSCSGLPAAITPSANRILLAWGGWARSVNIPMTCTVTTSNTILLAAVLTANAGNPTAVNANTGNPFDSGSTAGIFAGFTIWYPL